MQPSPSNQPKTKYFFKSFGIFSNIFDGLTDDFNLKSFSSKKLQDDKL